MAARRPLVLLLPLLIVVSAILLLWAGTVSADHAAPLEGAPEDSLPAPIVLTKTVGTGSGYAATTVVTVTAGTPVSYFFTVHNSSAVTYVTHRLDDSHLGLFTETAQLPPGASYVYVVTNTANVSVTNYATWTAITLGDPSSVVSDTASARVVVTAPPLLPAILLTKTVGLQPGTCATSTNVAIVQGTPVYFCYTVRNTGNTTLRRHTLVDDQLGTLLNSSPQTLTVDATWAYTLTAYPQVSQTNVATWTAWVTGTNGDVGSKAVYTDRTFVSVTPRVLTINFTKTVGTDNRCAVAVDPLTVDPGTHVVYCYRMTNQGNVPLMQHVIVDDRLGIINRAQSVAPGASLLITRAATALITTTNTATWTAYLTDTTSPRVAKNDTALVKTPRLPALQFAKTVGADPHVCGMLKSLSVLPGVQAFYCYSAKNVGNVPLTLHNLEDAAFGAPLLDEFPYTLGVGASVHMTAAVTAQVAQSTVATWTAWLTSTGSMRVRKTDTAALTILANPARIGLTKTVGLDGPTCPATRELLVPAGTVVYYCYAVENQGPLLLPKHQLYDDDLDRDILPADFLYDLMPGEIVTTRDLGIVVTKQITQTTSSFAIWQSYISDVLYAQASARTTVTVGNAATQVRLTVGPVYGASCPTTQAYEDVPGASYSLCLQIRNTGNVSLTQHTIDLPALALETTLAHALAPGASITLTRTDLPPLGPLIVTATRVYSVAVTSTANPSGAPFSTTAQSAAVAAPLAAERALLPAVRR